MRNKLVAIISAVTLVLGLSAIPSKADVENFGIAIGAIANIADFDTSGSETEGTGDGEVTTAAVTESHEFPSFFIEAAVRGTHAGLTVGFEHVPFDALLGNKTRTDAEDPADRDSDDGTYTAKAEISNINTFYVEPTFYLNEAFGIYAKAGVTHGHVDTLESIALGGNSSAYGNKGVWGSMFGFGLRGTHPSGLFAKIEHLQQDFDTITVKSGTGNVNTIVADIEAETTRVSVGYQF